MLRLEGFVIDDVQTGYAGLSSSAARPYAAIVLDLRLPDLDGLTVLERLRASGVDAPVVILTGFDMDPNVGREAMRAGAAAFRSKRGADDLAELLLSLAGVSMRGSDADGDDLDDQTIAPDEPDDGCSLAETLIALRRMLRSRFPTAPEQLVNDAAEDALLDFRAKPGRDGMWGDTSLASFLFVAAKRNLQDLLRSERRRRAREDRYVAGQALVTPDEPAVPRFLRIKLLRAFLAEVPEVFERRAFLMWLGGCRATKPLAEALGLADRAPKEQEAEVKRFKDRMTKRLKRHIESERA